MSAVEVAARFGLHQAGREWRGDCPVCGYKGSFVLSTGRNGRLLGWCSSCQDKVGIAAALRGAGPCSFRAERAFPPADKAAERAQKIARALAIWNGAEPVPGTPAEAYLQNRCIGHAASSPALRWRADVPHPSGHGRLPALLARIDGLDGGFRAIQRIYLKRDGSAKARIEPEKASLGLVVGGAVRLDAAAAEMVVGEGIETAAAAGKLARLPAWAAVACGNMARSMALPELVRSVVIAVDRDPAGERAAHEAAWRWAREGRRVRLLMPDEKDTDANDVLRKQVA